MCAIGAPWGTKPQGLGERGAWACLFGAKKAALGLAAFADRSARGVMRCNGGFLDRRQGAMQGLCGLLGLLAPNDNIQIRCVIPGHARCRSISCIVAQTIQERDAKEFSLLSSPMRTDPMRRVSFEQEHPNVTIAAMQEGGRGLAISATLHASDQIFTAANMWRIGFVT